MASSPIVSRQIDGEIMETVRDFILGGSKITADGNCSNEIKRRLFLGRNAMNNLDSILKSRDITLPTKICLVKAMVFPVVMYGCESLTIKKAAAAAATAKLLQSCPTLCDPMDSVLPCLYQLPELAQTHIHQVTDAIHPSHPLSSPSPPAFNLSQYQDLFQ